MADAPGCSTTPNVNAGAHAWVTRAVSRGELETAAAVYERSGRAAFAWRPPSWFVAADFLNFAEEEEVYLARLGHSVVGLASYHPPHHFLHCLYVDPQIQGCGIGRLLVAHLRARAGGGITLKVDLENHAAIAFYEAGGWTALSGPDDTGREAGAVWRRYRLD
jgi:ribosomal protein S18 acetylase RimI-like enzyme